MMAGRPLSLSLNSSWVRVDEHCHTVDAVHRFRSCHLSSRAVAALSHGVVPGHVRGNLCAHCQLASGEMHHCHRPSLRLINHA